ncbi:hypothetical protein [Kutzneria buriramensis]|uniref:Uncharacterized protein n=1 Tax=Kutzneria buriramensis TaxID=1045776 RepID=A0A3E0GVI5_9PSEU|nr:hypothetical protein [Kutzneria buriramensis]REH26947.1 hypothetical protein BCF44_1312 [Kutzneria buriramensis]
MTKFRFSVARRGGSLAGRRAGALVAGITLLLTSGFSMEAHAASKPAHNHFMQFVPRPVYVASNTWSAQANLYDRNGNLVYHWQTGSIDKQGESVNWGYFSRDPQAWLDMWARTGNGMVYSFLHKSAVCDYTISFDGAAGNEVHSCYDA